jgi:hypothetical protein
MAATNLPAAWSPLQTNAADVNGVLNFADLQVTNFDQRFYCVQAQ